MQFFNIVDMNMILSSAWIGQEYLLYSAYLAIKNINVEAKKVYCLTNCKFIKIPKGNANDKC